MLKIGPFSSTMKHPWAAIGLTLADLWLTSAFIVSWLLSATAWASRHVESGAQATCDRRSQTQEEMLISRRRRITRLLLTEQLQNVLICGVQRRRGVTHPFECCSYLLWRPAGYARLSASSCTGSCSLYSFNVFPLNSKWHANESPCHS